MRLEVYSSTFNFNLDLATINNLGRIEFFLLFLELFYFSLLIYYSYYLYKSHSYYAGIFWNFGLLSHFFIYVLLLISVIFVIPSLYYFNGLMLFSGIFATNVSNIHEVSPEMQFSDFWILCMDTNSTKTNVPSMGGHIVVAGMHGDKNYVCIDVAQAIHKTLKESSLARHGAYGFKTIFHAPNTVCAQFGPPQTPSSSQT